MAPKNVVLRVLGQKTLFKFFFLSSSPKNVWVKKKKLVRKFGVQRNFGPKRIFSYTVVGSKKIQSKCIKVKRILGPQKFWVKKIIDLRNVESEKFPT